MQDEQEILNDQDVRLKDIVGESTLPDEKPRRSSRKRRLVVMSSLLALLLLSVIGTYYLFRGKEVEVKASRRPTEKIASGGDLQKAAYDSLSGSLNGAATGMLSATSTTTGPGQAVKVTIPAATPSPATIADGPKIPAPVEPGISATMAPPPEALNAKQTENGRRETEARPELERQKNEAINASVSKVSTPKTGASIHFNLPPKSVKANGNSKVRTESVNEGDKPLASSERSERGSGLKPVLKRPQATPGFGAMLPVRLMGVLYTLRAGSLARLELTRDIRTERGRLKRGTVFTGALAGSDLDRAYVQIRGYIDPESNSLIRVEGDLLGSDGGAGLRGKQRRISPAWVKILDRAAQAGTQILTSVLGRNSSVIVATDPYGIYRSTGSSFQQPDNRTFVEVPAGTVGFLLITTLPEPANSDSHLANLEPLIDGSKQNDLSDAELAELLAEADAERIRAHLPRMSPELRQVAEMVLKEIETSDKRRKR